VVPRASGEQHAISAGATRATVFAHIQCCTADALDPDDRRAAVAIEPMTCPPDALRFGVDIIALAPGESFQGS
jgi:aldose 1-epimerase